MNSLLGRLSASGPTFRDALARGNLRVLGSLLGPAYRGFVRQRGKQPQTAVDVRYGAAFDWTYRHDFPEMARLYEAAKSSQWNAARDIDWTWNVDPENESCQLLPDALMPTATLPTWSGLPAREKARQRHGFLSWLLSQFLHGEQGALFAAAQVTESVVWLDAKLFGSTQVVDEGRHVEAFHNYLDRKLGKLYQINDNLYVIIDAVMSDSRWDVKFLGMQIMIEGLALGAFGTIRKATQERLLQDVLRLVITDEARHVHFGVLALGQHVRNELGERERREREDWAFEVALLLRDRFLAHEFYDEFYGHQLSRTEWDRVVSRSPLMESFRASMFERIVPNLKRIGLLGDRIRPRYQRAGLLAFEHGKAAPELTSADLLA